MRDWQEGQFKKRRWKKYYLTAPVEKPEVRTRTKGYCKSVDRETFEEALYKYTQGMIKHPEAAKMCGLSEPTFNLRANQYLAPQTYGELPEQFFGEEDDARGNKKWSVQHLLHLWFDRKYGRFDDEYYGE